MNTGLMISVAIMMQWGFPVVVIDVGDRIQSVTDVGVGMISLALKRKIKDGACLCDTKTRGVFDDCVAKVKGDTVFVETYVVSSNRGNLTWKDLPFVMICHVGVE